MPRIKTARQVMCRKVTWWPEDTPPHPEGSITDLPPYLPDTAETAAVLAALDLVITVDTSVAHLAGALGRPLELLLPYAPDWRWMLDRSDSPWYPTLRIHRQKIPGDWAAAIAGLAAEFRAGGRPGRIIRDQGVARSGSPDPPTLPPSGG